MAKINYDAVGIQEDYQALSEGFEQQTEALSEALTMTCKRKARAAECDEEIEDGLKAYEDMDFELRDQEFFVDSYAEMMDARRKELKDKIKADKDFCKKYGKDWMPCKVKKDDYRDDFTKPLSKRLPMGKDRAPTGKKKGK